jgi:nitroimidazol reductase NimA-like FMN-containing flavoprotein (pyridoxamine 5'-phosphate oxidase superfamily)
LIGSIGVRPPDRLDPRTPTERGIAMTGSDAARTPAGPARPGDVGRRVAYRRRELGLSRAQVAGRAAPAPEYLRYVEEQPADVAAGALVRLADALDTTADELRGGAVDVPPGRGGAAPRPIMARLSPAECWARLGTHGVGRIALAAPDAVEVLPVNYTVVDRTIAYRTTPARAAAAARPAVASFEVDRLDEALRQGWSVLATGPAEHVTNAEEVGLLERHAASEPWAAGERPAWVRLNPHHVTGREIHTVTTTR